MRLKEKGSLSWGNRCQQIQVNSTETLEAETAWIASRASVERVAGSTSENRERVHFIESGVNLCAHFCLFSEWAVLGCDMIWKHLWRLTLATVLRVEHQEQAGSRNATYEAIVILQGWTMKMQRSRKGLGFLILKVRKMLFGDGQLGWMPATRNS